MSEQQFAQVKDDIERLKQAMQAAIRRGDSELAGRLARSAGTLQKWLDAGMPGSCPVEVDALLAGLPEEYPSAAAKVQADIERLRRAASEASERENFDRGIALLGAADALKKWVDGGMPGSCPVDVEAVLSGGEAVPAPPAEEVPPPFPVPAPAPEENLPTPPSESLPSAPPPVDVLPDERTAPPPIWMTTRRDLNYRLEEALSKAADGDLDRAESELQDIIASPTCPPEVRSRADEELAEVRRRRKERLAEAVQVAKQVAMEQPGNIAAQREAWNRVLSIQPDNAEARESLDKLSQIGQLGQVRQQIEQFKAPLRAVRKDLSVVEAALLAAFQLLQGGEIPDAALRRELEKVHQQLTELRDDMVRASQGGASSERAQDFEKAIKKYSDALDLGYDVIKDDTTGEFIDVNLALRRTREAYWHDLRDRASRRHAEAEESLEKGYPEAAVRKLEEAQELVRKIEEGGEEIRRMVDDALSHARQCLENKQEARRLVTEALAHPDPEEALKLLVNAQQVYPGYPQLGQYILDKEEQLLHKVVQDMAMDLSAARGSLGRAVECEQEEDARREFERARQHCRTALNRGMNLSSTSPEREARRKEVERMLQEIDEREAAYYRLLGQLQRLDQAIRGKDIQLAVRLMEDLREEEKRDSRVQHRRTQLALLRDAQAQFVEAERLFFEEHDFQGTIRVCKVLQESASFYQRAVQLQRRAEARLWLAQARNEYQAGRLEEALHWFRQVAMLRGELPEEDRPLCQEAEAEAAQVERDRQRFAEMTGRLAEIQELRQSAPPNWTLWRQRVDALLGEAPIWLKSTVEQERSEGMKVWRESARRQAGTLEMNGDVQGAYRELKPLVDYGLLSANDPFWRRIQFAYHTKRARQLLESADPKDWEQAEQEAAEARNVAPGDQLVQAQKEFLEVVRQVTLKRAQNVARTPGSGAKEAIEILTARMERYEMLANDPHVRGRLIRYYLDVPDYARAEQEAQMMKYVSGEEKVAECWQQLVQVAKDLTAGQMEKAVSVLGELRARGPASDDAGAHLQELHEYLVHRALSLLRQTIRTPGVALGDEELVHHIQSLDLILQLDPNDAEAEKRMRELSDRLLGLVPKLRERVGSIRLEGSLQHTLTQADNLLGEMRSVLRTLERTGQGERQAPLRSAEQDFSGLVEQWRSAQRILGELEEKWARSVGGTWDIKGLRELLEKAEEVGEVQEVLDWEGRIGALEKAIDGARGGQQEPGLRAMLRRVQDAWRDEDFKTLVDQVGELQARVSRIRSDLDPRFIIPEKEVTFYDMFQGDHIVGLDELLQRVHLRKANQEEWETWLRRFEESSVQMKKDWDQMQTWLKESPPCLSKSLERMPALERVLCILGEQIQAQPQAILCRRAKEAAERYRRDQVLRVLQDRLQELTERRRWIEERLEDAKEPARQIEAFVQGRGGRRIHPLTNPRNRKELRRMIENLRQIDSCHPMIPQYEDLLKKYEQE